MNLVNLRELYLNLTLFNDILITNITNNLTVPAKKLEDISFQSFTATLSLCVHRCGKCEATRSFTCYTRNPRSGSDSANTSYFSTSTIIALGTLGGLIFVDVFISLYCFIFFK